MERYNANDGAVLCSLPVHASSSYPVETKYALPGNSHFSRAATDVFDDLMKTYCNGDMCGRLLYRAINNNYLKKAASYYSFHIKIGSTTCSKYPEKDGEFITSYPPLGETIRDVYNEASSNNNLAWGIIDHDRHGRETMGVGTQSLFTHDHTHQVLKNYHQWRQMGASGVWTVGMVGGEVASACLVPNQSIAAHSHAAMQLS